MVQGRVLSFVVPPALVLSAYLVWKSRRTTRKVTDQWDEETLSIPLVRVDRMITIDKNHSQNSHQVDTDDEKLNRKIFNHAVEQGASVLSRFTSTVLSFDAQVGGMSSHKQKFLSINAVYVLKPLRRDHRKVREIGFYELVNHSCPLSSTIKLTDRPTQGGDERNGGLRALRQFIPKYYGIVKFDGEKVRPTSASFEEDDYIILEDLTRKYSKPCIIDIKMGTQSFEPDATPEKKCKEVEKYPHQADFGFRIVGMRVYRPSDSRAVENGYVSYSKHYGRSLSSKSKLKDSLRAFFGMQLTTGSISSILLQLEEIKAWFLQNDSFCFYSSSIMIVHEGSEACEEAILPTVKMIDFARVRRRRGGDKGYLLGLQTLITLLQEIELEPLSPS